MFSFDYLKYFFAGIKYNWPGNAKVDRRILVIESDDWGAIRTPSKDALEAFNKRGFELQRSFYKVDALASETDLDSLFNLLLGIKNANGQHPVFTANAIMANPDFQKIRKSDFSQFYYEPFYETFKKYPEHSNNLKVWKDGIKQNIFKPQFHGREHLNIGRWLRALQKPDEDVHFSFKLECTYSGKDDYAFMEAYDWSSPEEIIQHKEIIKDGLRIFEETFGFKSTSFIAPCYNWDEQIEPFLASQGIECIQGALFQKAPTGSFNHYRNVFHTFAQKNAFGSYFNIRNVFFEPVYDPTKDWSVSAMAKIHAAFEMKRPAVISTHRLNYIGFIDHKNKTNGLLQLERLLKAVVKKWPDVEFITTDQLSNYIK